MAATRQSAAVGDLVSGGLPPRRDQLLKGAALNAVLIAEELMK